MNKRIEQRCGRNLSAALSTSGVTLILIVPALLLMSLFVREGIAATRDVQASVAAGGFGGFGRAWGWISARVAAQSNIDLPGLVRQAPSRLGEIPASGLGCAPANIIRFLCD